MEVTRLSESSIMSCDAADRALKLKILRATDSHFQSEVNYKTYHLLVKSQVYKGKMAAHLSMYVKLVETLTEVYRFDDKNPITVLCFPTQFKTAYNLIKSSEDMALWVMATLGERSPAFSLADQMTPCKDNGTTHSLPKTGKNYMYTTLRAVDF